MNDAEIKLQVKIDESSASKSVDTLTKKTEGLAKSFTNAGKKMTVGLTLPIVALGTFAVKSASDLQETINKVDVAFGDSSDSVKEWGDTTIKQFGIAKGTALDMAALFGDMATGMGMNTKEASKLSTNLTGLAGDLASFKNVSLDVAKTALAGIFTGETESLKQLGIIMTETNLEQFALSKGMKKNIKDMTQAEKIQLRYAYVTEMSKNAVGDFARTSKSTANQTRTMTETFKEVSAEVGQQLLPIVNKMLSGIINLLTWFSGLDAGTKKIILVVLALVAALGPLLMIVGGVLNFVHLLSLASVALNIGMLPLIGTIALIVAAVVAIGIAIYQVVQNWGTIKSILNAMLQTFLSVFGQIGSFVTGIFKGIINSFISMINFILNGFNVLVKGILAPFNVIIKGLNALPGKDMPLLKLAIPNIPKLEVGTNFVGQEGLAYLHQGEAVVPKKYNPAIGGGNGSYATLNIEMGDINMDGNKVGRAVTPYVTKTVKLAGGNV